MTQDPHLRSSVAHMPTVEEVMNGSPFDIIDSPWGHIERWRASTLATGTMGALAQVAAIVRNDAAELEEQITKLDAGRHQVLRTVNKLINFMSRVDALTSRVEALEAQRKADEATQRKLDEEQIELPPDFDRPQDPPPKEIGDDAPAPGGELHTVAAKEEPSSEDSDNVGDLPPELAEPPPQVPEPSGAVLAPPTALFGN
jgi:hypothetical protein